MKVLLLVTKSDNLGGAQVYVRNLASSFIEAGNEVLVAASGFGVLAASLAAKGIRYQGLQHVIHPIHPVKDILALRELIRVIKDFKPDIVSLNSTKIGILGRIACSILNVPSVLTVHGWSFTEGVPKAKASVYRIIERLLRPFSGHWIAVSKYDYELGIKSGVMIANRSRLIYNGIDPSRLLPRAEDDMLKKELGQRRSDKCVITMIARHDFQKDHLSLFEAVAKMDGFELWLIGDGPLMERNRDRCEKLGISQNTVFWGYREDPQVFLSFSDIFVLISNWEGFPLSTLEAMSLGLPVIVSDAGGAGEAVVNEESGIVVPKADPLAIFKALEALKENEALRRELGQKARERFLENFTIHRFSEETVFYFQKIVRGE